MIPAPTRGGDNVLVVLRGTYSEASARLGTAQFAVAVDVQRTEEAGQVVAPTACADFPPIGDLQPQMERATVEQQEHVANRLGVINGRGGGLVAGCSTAGSRARDRNQASAAGFHSDRGWALI